MKYVFWVFIVVVLTACADRDFLYRAYANCVANKDYRCALKVLNELLVSHPDDRDAPLLIAETYFLSGQLDTAKQVINKYQPLHSNDLRWYELMIDIGTATSDSGKGVGVHFHIHLQ